MTHPSAVFVVNRLGEAGSRALSLTETHPILQVQPTSKFARKPCRASVSDTNTRSLASDENTVSIAFVVNLRFTATSCYPNVSG
jgi:hypothetical protein